MSGAVLKMQVRAQAFHDLGARLDDQLEATKADAAKFEGASAGCAEAAKAVAELHKHIDKELEDGKLESLEVAQQIKDWLTRGSLVCENLGRRAQNNAIAARGRIAQAEQAVQLTKSMFDAEQKKIEDILAAAESLVPPAEPEENPKQPQLPFDASPEPARPPPPLKHRRLAGANGKRQRRAQDA